MTRNSGERGPVGQAAEVMKESLISKISSLESERKSPAYAGLIKAINLVDAFLHNHKEDTNQLDQLKTKVKSLLLNPSPPPLAKTAFTGSPVSSTPFCSTTLPCSKVYGKDMSCTYENSRATARGDAAGYDIFSNDNSNKNGSINFNNYLDNDNIKKISSGERSLTATNVNGKSARKHLSGSRKSLSGRKGVSSARGLPTAVPTPGELRRMDEQTILEKNGLLGLSNGGSRGGGGSSNNNNNNSNSNNNGSNVLYSMRSESGTRGLSQPIVDWSIPMKSLSAKAFCTGTEYGKMILTQDTLAREAETARLTAVKEAKRQLAGVYAAQFEDLDRRKKEALEAKRREAEEAKVATAAYFKEEMDRMEDHRCTQVKQRDFYQKQLDESSARKRQEYERSVVETFLDRRQIEEARRAEAERVEQLARSNLELRKTIKRELEESVAIKQQLRAEQMQADRVLVAAAAAKMEQDENARRKAIADRQEKQRKAFEKAGGHELATELEERKCREAEALRREIEEGERRLKEKEEARAKKKREETQEMIRTLDIQTAEKAAAAAELRDAKAAAKSVAKEEEKRRKAEDKALKQATQKTKSSLFQQQKQALEEEHRRKFNELRDAIPQREQPLHKDAKVGVSRGFTNLSVPAGFGLGSSNL
eukprot:CAMPEP_0175078052 /NCGR_PEP_ID=MMETSP0052_2-20121109/23844_1 /TAXON_ID=51329 ORGANISM="Polytomella parva, Strain SAG 63-3" /NCGR_SAMPLE_ID=MMETSP0052_2 /ASSEMBLY_ACC=CAM_ASM_000194 /LENGTH=650 /DNA_ID=CAMNT_0016347811 /DNA_START=56 /DNA_END=2008 /DNA_ORIENTATION=+